MFQEIQLIQNTLSYIILLQHSAPYQRGAWWYLARKKKRGILFLTKNIYHQFV